MDLGPRVTAWRESKGLTQAQLAAKIGKSRALISMIEGKGKHTSDTTQKTLQAIADALEITMEQFWGELPEPPKTEANA